MRGGQWGLWGGLVLLAAFLIGGRETYSPLYPSGPLTLVPGSLTTPSLVVNTSATSGWYAPLANHFGLAFLSVETVRFHAVAVTLHHTAALRFFHSEGQMAGGQRGHLTALRISTRQGGSSADRDGNDQIVVGHASTLLQLEGLRTHVLTAMSSGVHIVVIPDNGQGGTGNAEALNGLRSAYAVECSDPDNCALTLATAGVLPGSFVWLVSQGHGAITLADSGNHHLAGAFTGSRDQTIGLMFFLNRSSDPKWYEMYRSLN